MRVRECLILSDVVTQAVPALCCPPEIPHILWHEICWSRTPRRHVKLNNSSHYWHVQSYNIRCYPGEEGGGPGLGLIYIFQSGYEIQIRRPDIFRILPSLRSLARAGSSALNLVSSSFNVETMIQDQRSPASLNSKTHLGSLRTCYLCQHLLYPTPLGALVNSPAMFPLN